MADAILSTFKQRIARLILVPAAGGCFEIFFDGKLAFSKLAEHRFPDNKEIIDKIS